MAAWKVTVAVGNDAASFTSFVEEVGRLLRQALIAAHGPDVGTEVIAETMAYAWENWDRVGAMQNPAGYLYRVGQSNARRGIFRRPPPFPPSRSPGRDPGVGPGLVDVHGFVV